MNQALSSYCATVVLTLVCGAFSSVLAQTPSATPQPFAIQLTSSPPSFRSSSSDISANGRFVVFESNGDVSTERIPTRNNADGNREIFIADYAQRRIFQLTNTKNVPNPSPSPSPSPSPTPTPSPTPSPSPTASPVPTPADPALIKVEISNNRPMISLAPALSGSTRVYTIVFSSNAPNPFSYDGSDPGDVIAGDGNQELWIYQLPAVADVDLSSGADLPFQELVFAARFTQLTNTPASRVPTAGGPGITPFVADDNREATISDDGNIIAFISTRNLVATPGNTDGNPELFFYNRATSTFVQATNTVDVITGPSFFPVFQQNPSLSANGAVVAFLSNANLAANNDDGNGRGNAEIFIADFSGSAVSNIRQVTRTRVGANLATVNLLSPGRRLSRDGALIAFESLASDPKGNSTTNEAFLAVFVYTASSDTFAQVGSRALQSPGDIIHFPTFTDYNPTTLAPGSLVFASALNFRTDGTFPPQAEDNTGLNPPRAAQIFATQVPVTSSNTFTRLTSNPAGVTFGGTRPIASEQRKRIAFSLGGTELGGGNPDGSTELFYLLTPTVTVESSEVLSFFTGASNFPVPSSSPVASPTPTPSPTPSPSPSATEAAGLAAGQLSIIRAGVDLAPSNQSGIGGSEILRSPILPVELNGVSVSVNGAAAGLYFVGNSPSEIDFVMPIGLSAGTGTVVVHSADIGGGTNFRRNINIVAAQPDIFTTTNGPLGRAVACNVTSGLSFPCVIEPFSLMSPNSSGMLVPTVLELHLTGVRPVTGAASFQVTIGTTNIVPTSIQRNTNMFGEDLLTFTLPSTLAPGDHPIVVTVMSGGTFTSRPAATAPKVLIVP